MFSNIYQSLKSGFNQSWFKFLFLKTALAKLLEKDQEPSSWDFFKIYLSSWWWNRLWFRSCIQDTKNFDQFDNIIRSLQALKKAAILTETNCNLVAAHTNTYDLALAFSRLQQARLLTQDNVALVLTHANTAGLALAFSRLQQDGILTKDNVALVLAHANTADLALAFSRLQQDGILTKDNVALVLAHANTADLALALYCLQADGILTKDNFALVAAHANTAGLVSALYHLQKARLLTQDNFALVFAHANPGDLAYALSDLHRARLLTQDNFALVLAHANPSDLASALSDLHRARLLTRDNFEALLAPNHGSLVSNTAYQLIWSRIPNHLLTQVNFQRLLTAAEHANPMEALQRELNLILALDILAGHNLLGVPEHAAAFNQAQSTHTASVHRSVSASAVKLMKTYGDGLNLELKIKEMRAYVNGLADSPINQAAKRCIVRITAADYTFTDTSGVSIRQLLALAYTAIHDASKCSATLDDAKALFIEALYDIQRGYNLNAVGQDEGGEDEPICTGGTFNKLMEKLKGIHADVDVYYITHEGASSKFPRLAAAHAITYLQSLATPATAEGYLKIKDLLERLKTDESLAPMWELIKAGVQAELWDEFKEAYGNNPSNVKFLNLIDYGHQVNIPNLSEIETMLLASPGYQAYLEEQMRLNLGEQRLLLSLEKHNFWANRHSSQKAQENFDKQYGLVLKL